MGCFVLVIRHCDVQKYASFLMTSHALHLNIYELPDNEKILIIFHTIGISF